MKITGKAKKKTIVYMIAALMIILTVGGLTFAAYVNQGFQRGVVRNRDNEPVRFSSNYLQACPDNAAESGYYNKIITYTNDSLNSNNIDIDIYIYNYVLSNVNLINENDITYDFTIKLKGGTKQDYVVKKITQNEETISKDTANSTVGELVYKTSNTMNGNTRRENHYRVTIAGEDINNIKIIAIAKPNNMAYTGNQFLAAVIIPRIEAAVDSFSCTGSFTDKDSGNKPKDYDAFNYGVSISGGRAKVTLIWDARLLSIDRFFLAKLEERSDDYNLTSDTEESPVKYIYKEKNANDKGTLTFIMNYSDGTGDYLFPFYIVNKASIDSKNWSEMNEVVSVSAEQLDIIQ